MAVKDLGADYVQHQSPKRIDCIRLGDQLVAAFRRPGNAGELTVGKDVTYEVIYGNFGNARATQVSVSLRLPDGLSFVNAEPSTNHSSSDDKTKSTNYTWDLGDLGAGQSGIIKAQVHVASVSPDGSLVSARISAAGKDVSSPEKTAYSLRYAAKR